jgi:RNA polymerase sigma factor (sigma-70 family)
MLLKSKYASGAADQLHQTIAACIAGDDKNKELIYNSFYRYIMRVTLQYISKSHIAEELVNDSFIKIFKHLPYFKFPNDSSNHLKAFKGWTAKIATRTAIDFLRVDKNHFHNDELNGEAGYVDPVNVIDKLQFLEILKLVDKLPETQKMIFNMYEMEGYHHHEIAERLDIPAKHSRVYLARAKTQLRRLYQKETITASLLV